jgi:hypothetical protein
LIGGNVDLDLLSLFPQEYAKNHGRKQELGQTLKVNNGGERWEKATSPRRKKGVLYTPS